MREIIIGVDKADISENKRHRSAGVVSGNNSSRLLLDYKYEHTEHYEELLEHIFGRSGVGVEHFKSEMGSDIRTCSNRIGARLFGEIFRELLLLEQVLNSTSGTEPCVKRTAAEKANVRRGAGYHLAADVKSVILALIFCVSITKM